jgi:hypothetical protein
MYQNVIKSNTMKATRGKCKNAAKHKPPTRQLEATTKASYNRKKTAP